jgi:hypothetical protein
MRIIISEHFMLPGRAMARQLVSKLSAKPVHVGYVVDKVTLGQIFI